MYELKQTGERTYYIDCPAKIGIYRYGETEVCLIDSGSDGDAAKKTMRHLDAQNWSVGVVIDTHFHADHIGGNAFIRQRTGCPVYAPDAECGMIRYPILNPSLLYGGYPYLALRHKFFLAQPCDALPLTPEVLPPGLSARRLDGHSFAMTALQTDDSVWFLSDCLASERILEKYHVTFVYDVAAYIRSLETVQTLEGRLFIPAHAEVSSDIRPLAKRNLAKTYEILDLLLNICGTKTAFDDILQGVFRHYGLTMNAAQHALVGSTLRSYLSYLQDNARIKASFDDHKMMFQTI